MDSDQSHYLDVDVEVERRVYRGLKSRKRRTFRLVAVRNDETGGYHCYLTNIPAEDLPANAVSDTYAFRWQVEILFKAMKSHGHLDQLPSRKKAVVECLVWASILATMASQVLYRLVRQAVERDRQIPLLRWASLFERLARDVLIAAVTNSEVQTEDWFQIMIQEAPDPNWNRKDAALARMRAQEAAYPITHARLCCQIPRARWALRRKKADWFSSRTTFLHSDTMSKVRQG